MTEEQYEQILEAARKVGEALNKLLESISDAFDNLRLFIEELLDKRKCKTSVRYKIVKFISKVSGIEKKSIWKMTRHTYFARSCC